MFEIGRLCIKIAGRDAGLTCVVVEKLDDTFVLIDGQTRRRKCNVNHLEPLEKSVKIDSKADHKTVVEALKKIKIEVAEKGAPRKAKERPKKIKVKKEKPKKEPVKKVPSKKQAPVKEEKAEEKKAATTKKSEEKSEEKVVNKKK